MKTYFLLSRFQMFVWGIGLLLATLSVLPAATQNPAKPPRKIDFPYYSLRDGFTSMLMLVNNSPQPLDGVALIVHSRSGQSVTAPISQGGTIAAQDKFSVDLGSLLRSLSIDTTGDYATAVCQCFTPVRFPLRSSARS